MTVSRPHVGKGMVLYFIRFRKKNQTNNPSLYKKLSGPQATAETNIRLSLVMLDVQTHTSLKVANTWFTLVLGLPKKPPETQKWKNIGIKVLSLNSLSTRYPSHCETSKIFDSGLENFVSSFPI